MRRKVTSLAIGAVLALLMAAASQFLLIPFVGAHAASFVRALGVVVFWGMMVCVVTMTFRTPR